MKNDAQQDGFTVRGIKSLVLLFAVGSLLASGCASQRVVTNLKPGADPALKSPAGRFYVAGLKFVDTNPQVQPNVNADFEKNLLPLIRQESSSRYPALFASEAPGSIPIGVEMQFTGNPHSGKQIAWMLCTADICGTILPCPAEEEDDYVVKAGVWNGKDGIQGPPLDKGFRDELHMWVSVFSPAALITIPGDSDFPKMSGTIFGLQSQMHECYQRLAQQIATALAQLVVTKDREYWTAPIFEQRPPGSPSFVPTTLPPPAEQTTPF